MVFLTWLTVAVTFYLFYTKHFPSYTFHLNFKLYLFVTHSVVKLPLLSIKLPIAYIMGEKKIASLSKHLSQIRQLKILLTPLSQYPLTWFPTAEIQFLLSASLPHLLAHVFSDSNSIVLYLRQNIKIIMVYKLINGSQLHYKLTMHKICENTGIHWLVFSRIRTES